MLRQNNLLYINIRMVNIICVYLQHSENPILARQDRYEASQVLWGQTCDIIDFVSREVVVLVLAVTVVVVDVTCTHKKISSGDMPGKKIHAVQYSGNHAVLHESMKMMRRWSYMALTLSVRLASKVRNCLPFLVNPRTWEPEQTKIFSCAVPAAPPRSILAIFCPGSVLNTGWNRVTFLVVRKWNSRQ